MSRRLAAVIVALVALGAIAALLRLRDGDSGGDSLARMSADGEPIAMDVPSTLGFFGKPTGEAILIAERQGVRFLRLPDEDGTSCWATSDRSSGFWSIRSFSCDTEYPFPDPQQPVIVLASVRGDGDLLTYNELRGFAADGVKRIGALDAAGRVRPLTDVVDNVFTAPPPSRIRGIAALDEDGEIVWRSDVIPE
jgi:hypothetical protein